MDLELVLGQPLQDVLRDTLRIDETQSEQGAAREAGADPELPALLAELSRSLAAALRRQPGSGDPTQIATGAETVHFSAVIKQRVYCLLSFPEVEKPLSPQQAELALCLRRGMVDKEIAAALKVSTETVQCYLDRIYVKLKVSTRGQVAAHPALLLLEARSTSDAAAAAPGPQPPAHRPATGNDGERRGTTGNDGERRGTTGNDGERRGTRKRRPPARDPFTPPREPE